MTNRNKCKQWFITFPKCRGITVMEFLTHVWTDGQLEEYAGVMEKHEQEESVGEDPWGGWHFHVNVKLKFGLSKSKMLNLMKIKYPEDYKRIQVESTRQRCVDARDGYLSKEGQEVFSKIEDKVAKNTRRMLTQISAAQRVADGIPSGGSRMDNGNYLIMGVEVSEQAAMTLLMTHGGGHMN